MTPFVCSRLDYTRRVDHVKPIVHVTHCRTFPHYRNRTTNPENLVRYREHGYFSECVTKKKKKKKTCNIFLKTELSIGMVEMPGCGRLPKTRTMREIGSLAENRKLAIYRSLRIIRKLRNIGSVRIFRSLREKRSGLYVPIVIRYTHTKRGIMTQRQCVAGLSPPCCSASHMMVLCAEELFPPPLWGTPTPVEGVPRPMPYDPSQILQAQNSVCALHLALRGMRRCGNMTRARFRGMACAGALPVPCSRIRMFP
jgi:hypothetical protein